MATGRMLKRVISTSRRLAKLPDDTSRLLYTWILPFLDVNGRYHADPLVIKGSVVPRLKHITPDVITVCLGQLVAAELITIYEVDGDQFLEFVVYEKHQSFREWDKPKYPPPCQQPVDNLFSFGQSYEQGKQGTLLDCEQNTEVPPHKLNQTNINQTNLCEVINPNSISLPLKPLDAWASGFLKEVRETLNLKGLSNRERDAFLMAVALGCERIRRRYWYMGCGDCKTCNRIFHEALKDLKKQIDKGAEIKWRPAYYGQILENFINVWGEDNFPKQTNKDRSTGEAGIGEILQGLGGLYQE